MPTGHLRDWPEQDRRTVTELAKLTYLEFCRIGSPEDLRRSQERSLKYACRVLGLTPWCWASDRVMAGLFNRFYLMSARGYVSPEQFVARATESDRRYAGVEMSDFAHNRATIPWTTLAGTRVTPSYH